MCTESTLVITSKNTQNLIASCNHISFLLLLHPFRLEIYPGTEQSSGNYGLVNIFLLIYSIDYIVFISLHQTTNCDFLMRRYSG